MPDKDAENYKEQTEQFFRAIGTLDKTSKLVEREAFSDSVISFLRGFTNRDDIEHVMDHDQPGIAFNNGYLYDITTDDYRRINKDDFVWKAMSVPYNDNIPNRKAEDMYSIICSFSEHEALAKYFCKY